MHLRLCAVLGAIPFLALAGGPVAETLVVDGRTRTYTLYAPENAKPKLPLVIVLHGSGGDGDRMVRTSEFHTLGAAKGFLVVYPNGYQKNWNDGRDIPAWPSHREKVDDIHFLSTLIDKMVAERNADPSRIYITGISNGGLMSHRAGCELAGKVAAIAPVVRTITTKLAASCNPQRPIPILMFFGTADKLVPFEGGKQIMAGDFAVETMSAENTIRHWAGKNRCKEEAPRAETTTPGGKVTHIVERGCAADVEAYILHGAGHSWPVKPRLAATEVIWSFFEQHPRR